MPLFILIKKDCQLLVAFSSMKHCVNENHCHLIFSSAMYAYLMSCIDSLKKKKLAANITCLALIDTSIDDED